MEGPLIVARLAVLPKLLNGQAFVTKAFDKEGHDYWTLFMDAMKVDKTLQEMSHCCISGIFKKSATSQPSPEHQCH